MKSLMEKNVPSIERVACTLYYCTKKKRNMTR